MSRAKAFWLGLGCTLAVLLPIYLAVAAVIFTRSAPADTVQSGVPIAQPTLGDEKNFLLMTGPEQPETFVLLRFDALEGNLCSVAIPGETVVLVNGRPATLADAAEQAGPAQAAAALMETLDIEIDNYLYCTADRLVDLAAGFGTARIPLANYMTPEALGQLQLNIPGVQTVSLTPQMQSQCQNVMTKSTHFWWPSARSGLENSSFTPGKVLSVSEMRLFCSDITVFM